MQLQDSKSTELTAATPVRATASSSKLRPLLHTQCKATLQRQTQCWPLKHFSRGGARCANESAQHSFAWPPGRALTPAAVTCTCPTDPRATCPQSQASSAGRSSTAYIADNSQRRANCAPKFCVPGSSKTEYVFTSATAPEAKIRQAPPFQCRNVWEAPAAICLSSP